MECTQTNVNSHGLGKYMGLHVVGKGLGIGSGWVAVEMGWGWNGVCVCVWGGGGGGRGGVTNALTCKCTDLIISTFSSLIY